MHAHVSVCVYLRRRLREIFCIDMLLRPDSSCSSQAFPFAFAFAFPMPLPPVLSAFWHFVAAVREIRATTDETKCKTHMRIIEFYYIVWRGAHIHKHTLTHTQMQRCLPNTSMCVRERSNHQGYAAAAATTTTTTTTTATATSMRGSSERLQDQENNDPKASLLLSLLLLFLCSLLLLTATLYEESARCSTTESVLVLLLLPLLLQFC